MHAGQLRLRKYQVTLSHFGSYSNVMALHSLQALVPGVCGRCRPLCLAGVSSTGLHLVQQAQCPRSVVKQLNSTVVRY
jgi:hypothetical protein